MGQVTPEGLPIAPPHVWLVYFCGLEQNQETAGLVYYSELFTQNKSFATVITSHADRFFVSRPRVVANLVAVYLEEIKDSRQSGNCCRAL